MPRAHQIYTIAIIGFIYTLHIAIPMYSNSSFLSLFASESTVGLIYMMGSAVSILGFLFIPQFIRKYGNYRATVWLILIQIVLYYAMITSESASITATIFVLQTAVISLIGLCIDIFLEAYTEPHHIGKIRGLFSATLNASWVISPLIGSMLINGSENYKTAYVAALSMLFPLLYLIYRNFPRFKDPNYTHISPHQLIKHIMTRSSWVKLFIANIILQTFYSWMVVYSTIYLNKNMGFGWTEMGLILTIMLIPFPLIQYPLGKLSDQKVGERKIMMTGFLIMGLATMALSFIGAQNLTLWIIGLFMTRVGAAAAEIMIETYFFKTVPTKDSSVLGLFRLTRPSAYFFAPIITYFGLMITSDRYIFVILGLVCLLAIYPAYKIKDTI